MKAIIRILALALLAALLAFLVPSATPVVIGEGLPQVLPVYDPVTLTDAAEAIPYGAKTPYAPHADGWLPEKAGYRDDTLSVRVETMRAYNTTIMLCWIQVADPSQLRTALCKPYPSKQTARASKIAQREQAVVAINGDYFMHRKEGFIVRNGETLRENPSKIYDTLIIDDKGDMHIIRATTQKALDAFDGTIVQAFAFGPGLVIDGEVQSKFATKENAPTKRTQRIALCQLEEKSYLVVATEGPENKNSAGLKMSEFAELLGALGVKQAYNFDGGSSSTIVLQNKKINSLSTGKIRAVGDIIYFVTAQPQKGSETK